LTPANRPTAGPPGARGQLTRANRPTAGPPGARGQSTPADTQPRGRLTPPGQLRSPNRTIAGPPARVGDSWPREPGKPDCVLPLPAGDAASDQCTSPLTFTSLALYCLPVYHGGMP